MAALAIICGVHFCLLRAMASSATPQAISTASRIHPMRVTSSNLKVMGYFLPFLFSNRRTAIGTKKPSSVGTMALFKPFSGFIRVTSLPYGRTNDIRFKGTSLFRQSQHFCAPSGVQFCGYYKGLINGSQALFVTVIPIIFQGNSSFFLTKAGALSNQTAHWGKASTPSSQRRYNPCNITTSPRHTTIPDQD